MKSEHQRLLANEPLRRWFLDTASPAQLLWFAVGHAATGRVAIRFVAQRFPDWSWVRELTVANNAQQLRALAIQCNHKETESYVRSALLRESTATYSDGKVEEGAEAIDPNTRQGAGARLVESLENGDVMQRLIDLDEAMRVSLGRSAESAKAICGAILHSELS